MTREEFKRMIAHIEYLGNLPMESLRASVPQATDTRAELIRLTRQQRRTRGDMIAEIIDEEFSKFIDE